MRAALAIVIKQAPNEVWPVLGGFYEIATRVERERLSAITSATKLFAYNVSRIGPGALFDTPLSLGSTGLLRMQMNERKVPGSDLAMLNDQYLGEWSRAWRTSGLSSSSCDSSRVAQSRFAGSGSRVMFMRRLRFLSPI